MLKNFSTQQVANPLKSVLQFYFHRKYHKDYVSTLLIAKSKKFAYLKGLS
jgi:hypothetical protein